MEESCLLQQFCHAGEYDCVYGPEQKIFDDPCRQQREKGIAVKDRKPERSQEHIAYNAVQKLSYKGAFKRDRMSVQYDTVYYASEGGAEGKPRKVRSGWLYEKLEDIERAAIKRPHHRAEEKIYKLVGYSGKTYLKIRPYIQRKVTQNERCRGQHGCGRDSARMAEFMK